MEKGVFFDYNPFTIKNTLGKSRFFERSIANFLFGCIQTSMDCKVRCKCLYWFYQVFLFFSIDSLVWHAMTLQLMFAQPFRFGTMNVEFLNISTEELCIYWTESECWLVQNDAQTQTLDGISNELSVTFYSSRTSSQFYANWRCVNVWETQAATRFCKTAWECDSASMHSWAQIYDWKFEFVFDLQRDLFMPNIQSYKCAISIYVTLSIGHME